MQTANVCSTSTPYISQWLSVNALVALLIFMVAAFLYSFSNIMPSAQRQKLRSISSYEIYQAIFGVLLIAALLFLATAACNVESSLTSSIVGASFQSPIEFSQYYINNLLFNVGNGLTEKLYGTSIMYYVSANLVDAIATYPATAWINMSKIPLLSRVLVGDSNSVFYINAYLSPDFSKILLSMSTLVTDLSVVIVATFGLLFIIFILLPLINATAFPLLIPVALVVRTIGFAGPQLREASDQLIALAIGFYFILPLAITTNAYIMTWLFCGIPTQACNPYMNYVGSYSLANLPSSSSFLSQNPGAISNANLFGVSLPINLFLGFYGTGFSAGGSGGDLVSEIQALFTEVLDAPAFLSGLIGQVAQYMFQGIVLIAIDLGVTTSFIIGIYKSLSSLSNMFNVESFWG